MKIIAGAAVAASLFMLGHASAADLPVKAYYKAPPVAYLPWDKCYVGVTLGYNRQQTAPSLTTTDPNLLASIVLNNVNTRPGDDPDGVTVGGTAGCNRQYGSLVLSGETDLSYLSARSRFLSIQGGANVTNTGQQETDVLGTVRGRLGYAVDKTLFYATGGLAYGHVKSSFSILPAVVGAPALAAGEDTWKVGWTVGGGIEHMFAPSWSVKAEYLYYDLGNSTLPYLTVAGGPLESGTMSYKNTGYLIRAGLNYHFN